MELELKKTAFDVFDPGGELTLTPEESTETIVPDYCPDIARIITSEGTVFLHSRELRDGKAAVAGTVRVSVLYTPDGEGGIRSLEFSLPFTAESDAKALSDCTVLLAEAEPVLLETRMLNPRKLFTHCRLLVRLTGWQKRPLCLAADVEAEEGLCVEKRLERQHATLTTYVGEKDFSCTDTVTLSPGKDGAAELLCSHVSGTVTETKLVGSKLILKGMFSLRVLYRTPEGGCAAAFNELPFSQIMEVGEIGEGAQAAVELQFTGTDLQLDSGDPEGRDITAVLYLHAVVMIREERDLELLTDLYSTAWQTAYDAEPKTITSFAERMVRRQTVREVLEIGVVAQSILLLTASCGPVSVAREGMMTALRTGVSIRALYLDEGGVPLVAERCVEVSCQLELPEGCRITARGSCPEELQGSLGDRGIEVRFPVDFCIKAEEQTHRLCITAARLDRESIRDLTGAPSLVLRYLGPQETAWALAKAHNTTVRAILAANQRETEGDLPHDQLLLIPRTRPAVCTGESST